MATDLVDSSKGDPRVSNVANLSIVLAERRFLPFTEMISLQMEIKFQSKFPKQRMIFGKFNVCQRNLIRLLFSQKRKL